MKKFYRKKPELVTMFVFKMPKRRPQFPGPDSKYKGVYWGDFGSSQQHPYIIVSNSQKSAKHVLEDSDCVVVRPNGDTQAFSPVTFHNLFEQVIAGV